MPSQVGTTQEGGQNNGDPFSLTFDGSPLEDDVAYLFLGHGTTTEATFGLPAQGWVEQDSIFAGALQYELWTRVMGSTPDSGVTITPTPDNPQDATHATALVLRDVDTTNPVDALVAWAQIAAASSTPDAPAITTVTDGALVLTAVGYEATSVPAGYTEESAGFTNDSNAVGMSVASRTVATAGLEDPGTWTLGPAVAWYVMTVAARPAATGSPPVEATDGAAMMPEIVSAGTATVRPPPVEATDGGGSMPAIVSAGTATVSGSTVQATDGAGSMPAIQSSGTARTLVTATDGAGSMPAIESSGTARTLVRATDGGGSMPAIQSSGTATVRPPPVQATDGGGMMPAIISSGVAIDPSAGDIASALRSSRPTIRSGI